MQNEPHRWHGKSLSSVPFRPCPAQCSSCS
jgi:hypothetical protein